MLCPIFRQDLLYSFNYSMKMVELVLICLINWILNSYNLCRFIEKYIFNLYCENVYDRNKKLKKK